MYLLTLNLSLVVIARYRIYHENIVLTSLSVTSYLIELAGQESNVPAESGGHDGHHQDQAGVAAQQGGNTAQQPKVL